MCLPVPCLKVIVFIGSICSIAISVALLARNSPSTQSPSTSRSRKSPSSAAPASRQSAPPSSASTSPPSSFYCWESPGWLAPSSPLPRDRARGNASWDSSRSASSSSSSCFWEPPSSSSWDQRLSSELTAPMAQKQTSSKACTDLATRLTPNSAKLIAPAR